MNTIISDNDIVSIALMKEIVKATRLIISTEPYRNYDLHDYTKYLIKQYDALHNNAV